LPDELPDEFPDELPELPLLSELPELPLLSELPELPLLSELPELPLLSELPELPLLPDDELALFSCSWLLLGLLQLLPLPCSLLPAHSPPEPPDELASDELPLLPEVPELPLLPDDELALLS
jgi:hypothetical protein